MGRHRGRGVRRCSSGDVRPGGAREREALLAWFAASTRELLDALREAGSDRGCWTWWSSSESPQTTGRIPTDWLRLDGDRHVLDQLIAWEPEE